MSIADCLLSGGPGMDLMVCSPHLELLVIFRQEPFIFILHWPSAMWWLLPHSQIGQGTGLL